MNLASLPFAQPLVALWTAHPGDLLGDAIKFLTHGPVEHAGFLRQDQKTISEAYLPKVRSRTLVPGERALILLFAIEGMTPDIAAKFERYLVIATDPRYAEEYSVTGLFGFELNVPPPGEEHVFCSEWAMQSIRKVAPILLPLARCEDYQVSPADLYRSTRLLPVAW